MKNTRTNALLLEIIVKETDLPSSKRAQISILINGQEFSGKILTHQEYYDRPLNNKYKDLHHEVIEIEREKCISSFEKDQNLDVFPDTLRQIFLHLLSDSGRSYQFRVADIVGFSFD